MTDHPRSAKRVQVLLQKRVHGVRYLAGVSLRIKWGRPEIVQNGETRRSQSTAVGADLLGNDSDPIVVDWLGGIELYIYGR